MQKILIAFSIALLTVLIFVSNVNAAQFGIPGDDGNLTIDENTVIASIS